GRRFVKTEKRMNERRLTGAIWTKQTNGFTTQIAAQVFQNWPVTERNAETMKIDHWWLSKSRLRFDRLLWNRSGECHTCFIALCSDNSKRNRVRRLCPSAEKQQCMLTHPRALKFCRLQEFRSGTQAC